MRRDYRAGREACDMNRSVGNRLRQWKQFQAMG